MLENLQQFTQAFPDWLQWFAVALVAAIPFVESYTGTVVGTVIGLSPPVAAAAAIVGNAITVVLIVVVTLRIRRRVTRDSAPRTSTRSRARAARLFARFGVPGVAFLVHPTQVASAVMVGLGAPPRKVILWELAAIVFYGIVIAVAATLGLHGLDRA